MTDPSKLIEQIDAILPQIHCGQCGYDGCQPYAVAIAEGQADINQCPPGKDAVIEQLAQLLGLAPKPLDTTYGHPKPRAVAVIDETQCIGCTFCLRACPVDAIVGAAKLMHTVISQECTGCERCLAPCPVDCIHMQPVSETGMTESLLQASARAQQARQRYHFRKLRLAQNQQAKLSHLKISQNQQTPIYENFHESGVDTKQAIIQAAMARARAKLATQASALGQPPVISKK